MFRVLIVIALIGITTSSFAKDWLQVSNESLIGELRAPKFTDQIPRWDTIELFDGSSSQLIRQPAYSESPQENAKVHSPDDVAFLLTDLESLRSTPSLFDLSRSHDLVIRGQSPGEGDGAGAAAATDPSVPLTQLQLQNVFTPETYNASGYSNTFIVQPVIPLNIGEDAFFPYHIIRPTLPVIAPTADPDGPLGVQGGLGDTTIVDAFIHPCEELKTNFGIGYVATLPTRTHPQLGRGEWQLGPSAVVISRAVPKWIFGGLVEIPFSLQSDAYAVQMQAIALRLLPNEWFVGWGDQILKFDDQNGGYEIPLSLQFGKVVKVGETPLKLFVEPIYTPVGLRSGPGGAEWGIKLNLTILLPGAKLDDPILSGR